MKLTKKALLAAKPYGDSNILESFQVDGLGGYDYNYNEPEELRKERFDEIRKMHSKRYVILFEEYTYEDYEGSAYVLGYDKSLGKFFEVHGGHCSCYGLEEQWDPEYCTTKELSETLDRRKKEWEGRKDSDYYYESTGTNATFFNWLETVK